MKNKLRSSLGRKLLILIIIMSIVLSAIAILISYITYRTNVTELYRTMGDNIVQSLASQLDPTDLDRYLETNEKDESYYKTLDIILDFKNSTSVEYLYVVKPVGKGVTFIFDSDMSLGGYSEGGGCELGEYIDLDETFSPHIPDFAAGREIDPLITHGEYGWLMTVVEPVKYADGTMAAYVMADISINKLMDVSEHYLILLSSILILVTAAFAFGFVMLVRKLIVRPIETLTKETGAFVETNKDSLAGGKQLFAKLEIKTGDELEQLARSVVKMENDTVDYVRNLTAVTAEKERIGAELGVATQIQADMLPRIFPAFPGHDEFDVFASMDPAREVGGDFYDFFLIDETHLGVVIADVSGKGVPAALFMVISKTLIKNHACSGASLGSVFTKVNNQLCENNEAGMFVTAWMGVLDTKTGVLKFVNAGHNKPLVCHENKWEWLDTKPGFVLAGFEDFRYKEASITLQAGDKLFLYTDGVTEALDPEQALYSDERLKDELNRLSASECDVNELVRGIKSSVYSFANGAEQADDITMLALDYRGAALETELTVSADTSSLSAVNDFIESRLDELGCSKEDKAKLLVASEELFVNIAHYAYTDSTPGSATVHFAYAPDGTVRIRFCDSGTPFNPLTRRDPDVSAAASERPIGGLGIFMVKNSMDSTRYEYANNQNVITIEKNISGGQS